MSSTIFKYYARDAEIKYIVPNFKEFVVYKEPRFAYMAMTEVRIIR